MEATIDLQLWLFEISILLRLPRSNEDIGTACHSDVTGILGWLIGCMGKGLFIYSRFIKSC